MIFQIDNWVFWAIMSIGLGAYALLFDAMFNHKKVTRSQLQITEACFAILPLLGLLGTIMGLLQTFDDLASSHINFDNMIAGGVGTALGSTQLGLILAVPGLLALSYLRGHQQQPPAKQQAY